MNHTPHKLAAVILSTQVLVNWETLHRSTAPNFPVTVGQALGGSDLILTMEFPVQLDAIHGAQELHHWFGYWPTFHDAEILSLYLNRGGASSMAVHTWEMTKELDAKGFYVLTKHVVVEFSMKEVFDLSLNGFSRQNVVNSISFEKTENGYRLTLGDCFGIAGTIDASEISVRLTPGKPEPA